MGNLSAKRDWGHAKDYVRAMHLMIARSIPNDYVISTGICYTVKDFLQAAFSKIDKDYRDYIEIDPELYRPAEVDYLRGDSSKAQKELNWKPEISFDTLVEDMVLSDIKASYK